MDKARANEIIEAKKFLRVLKQKKMQQDCQSKSQITNPSLAKIQAKGVAKL
jgi:hypothetical protein